MASSSCKPVTKVQRFPRNLASTPATERQLHSRHLPHSSQQQVSSLKLSGEEFVSKLLKRRWSLFSPDSKIHQIMVSKRQTQNCGGLLANIDFLNNTHPYLGESMDKGKNGDPSFYVVRDDLLHPLANGNKARKLDGLLPLLEDFSLTDVVTCGGCQSAHTAAVAVSCAERGLRSHLLLRGEQREILTGYNMISTIYGNVTYVPRTVYANRKEILAKDADIVAGHSGSIVSFSDILVASITSTEIIQNSDRHQQNWLKRVIIINEGAGDVVGLLAQRGPSQLSSLHVKISCFCSRMVPSAGVIRLVQFLSNNHNLGKEKPVKLVVDAGTGTTAIGLGIGAICSGLPWKVTAVMLADTIEGYRKQEQRLISTFKSHYVSLLNVCDLNRIDGGIVDWVEHSRPRKFGNIFDGELVACQRIAQQTGILVDPIYTLAAWELAT